MNIDKNILRYCINNGLYNSYRKQIKSFGEDYNYMINSVEFDINANEYKINICFEKMSEDTKRMMSYYGHSGFKYITCERISLSDYISVERQLKIMKICLKLETK